MKKPTFRTVPSDTSFSIYSVVNDLGVERSPGGGRVSHPNIPMAVRTAEPRGSDAATPKVLPKSIGVNHAPRGTLDCRVLVGARKHGPRGWVCSFKDSHLVRSGSSPRGSDLSRPRSPHSRWLTLLSAASHGQLTRASISRPLVVTVLSTGFLPLPVALDMCGAGLTGYYTVRQPTIRSPGILVAGAYIQSRTRDRPTHVGGQGAGSFARALTGCESREPQCRDELAEPARLDHLLNQPTSQ
jgi:hypothetical protein